MPLPDLSMYTAEELDTVDWKALTAEQLEVFDAEDRRGDDTTSGIDWDAIVADYRAELRGERPPSITVNSFEEFQALLRQADQDIEREDHV